MPRSLRHAVVLGAGGMLGRDLVALAPAGVKVTPVPRAACDVTSPAAVAQLLEATRPDWVVNAAAYTAVDGAEAARDDAMRVNGEGPGVVGAAAAGVDAAVLHLSTDYVFPGTGSTPWREDDATNPVNWYGHTKLVGEQALAASGARHVVVRVQWLYAGHGRNFVRTMWDRARQRQATRVVHDQVGALTHTADLAPALWSAAAQGITGRLHLAAAGAHTWYDAAARIFAAADAAPLLSPCTTAEFPTPAARPANSRLDTRRAAALGLTLPDWTASLRRWLDDAGTSPNG
jgi:dTDP-4-dehydrorhamnose reductase